MILAGQVNPAHAHSVGAQLPSESARDGRCHERIAARLRELGLKIAATKGTCEYLGRFGITVDQVVGKISDGHGMNAVKLIESGEIAFVVNTPQGRGGRTDGEQIRKAANSHHVSSVTTVEAALAAVQGMAEMVGREINVRSLQEFHT